MIEQIEYISVDDIIPNRFQPRKKFDEDDLNELAESIKQHGIIQPLVLRRLGNKFEIIAGERRYKAANIVGLKQVPSIVMDLDDKTSAEIALAENIQRKDLTSIEKAKSYRQILGLGQITQEELAKKMGKSQPTVSNTLRLLDLTDEVQHAILQNRISERHARSLLSLKNPELQNKMLNEIIDNRLTVRETDLAIKNMINEFEDNKSKEEVKEEKNDDEIIDFTNNDLNIEKANKEFISEIENIQMTSNNNNKSNIPEFDQIDINSSKNPFINNYVNLDDEEANMNFGNENTNNEFNNFIDIPNDIKTLNVTKEKEEKEVSETPMISEPINEKTNNEYQTNDNMNYNDNLNYNSMPQFPDPSYQNNGMMPPQENMYQPYPAPNMPYMDPTFQNPYQQVGMQAPMPNMYNNEMMPPQGNMYQPYPTPNMPYMDPAFQNPYQQVGMQGPMPNMYNNGMVPPPIDMNNNDNQSISLSPSTSMYSQPPQNIDNDVNNKIETNQDVAPQAIIMQHDITGAVAVIRNTVMNLQNNGYMIDINEDDLANSYVINIKIEK